MGATDSLYRESGEQSFNNKEITERENCCEWHNLFNFSHIYCYKAACYLLPRVCVTRILYFYTAEKMKKFSRYFVKGKCWIHGSVNLTYHIQGT